MPATVGQKPIGRAGSSTVVQPPYGTQTTKPTVLTRALVAVRKQFFTSADMQDPQRLYQVMYQMQQGQTTALHALASSPLSAGVLLQNNVFTAGQTLYLNHGLSRAYSGWLTARVQGSGASSAYGGFYTAVADAQSVALTTAGTFYVIPGEHAGPTSGTTIGLGGGTITVANAGTYLISWTGSVLEGNAINVQVFVNGVAQTDLECQIQASGLSALPGSLVGLHALNAGDIVTLRASCPGASSVTLNVHTSNLTVALMGGGSATLTEAALPANVSNTQQIALTASLAGTYDVFVF